MRCHDLFRAGLVLAVSLAAWPGLSAAQVAEVEPNDRCEAPQAIGLLPALPAAVSGALDVDFGSDPPIRDVDFYALAAAPGTRLIAELRAAGSGQGTLGDPFLGLFDSACVLVAVNDDSSLGLESRLEFTVPADGQFLVAATGCCDGGFTGSHHQEGSYTLHILEAPPAIGSISGRLVDAVTGQPLPGSQPPYAFAELHRCGDSGCWEVAAFTTADGDGFIRFETDGQGNALAAGSYLVAARADGYEVGEAGPFDVAEAEHADVGDILLEPPPLVFSDVTPCGDLPATGGTCRYSVRVRNNRPTAVMGLGWSNVQGYGTGSPLGYTHFSAQRAQTARLGPLSARVLSFSFDVPTGVADGAFFCTDAWFSDRENAFLGTVRTEFLFCVSKQAGAFTAVEPKAAMASANARGAVRGARQGGGQ